MDHACVPADSLLMSKTTLAHTRTVLLVCFLLSGCGNGPNTELGFVNETEHSDAHLWSLWKAAQRTLSQQIDLNPLERQLNGAAPHMLPGDPRTTGIMPHQVVVAPQPDVLSASLYAATGSMRADPTGLVQCSQPCNVEYAPAYSTYTRSATHYAASWEFQGNNFDVLVQYEFENQILHALGYDLRWR